jgi:hypothetical protein
VVKELLLDLGSLLHVLVSPLACRQCGIGQNLAPPSVCIPSQYRLSGTHDEHRIIGICIFVIAILFADGGDGFAIVVAIAMTDDIDYSSMIM